MIKHESKSFFIIAAIIFGIYFCLFLYRMEKAATPTASKAKYEQEVIDNDKGGECLEIKTPKKTDQ